MTGHRGDVADCVAVLREAADRRRYHLSDNVIDFMAGLPADDPAALICIMDEVHTLACRAAARLDEAFVRDCLSRGLPGEHTLNIARVAADATTAFYGMTLNDLSQPPASRRKRQVRFIAMFLCFELSELSMQRIGQLFDRNADTVGLAWRKVVHQMDEEPALREEITRLRQLIEQRLTQSSKGSHGQP